MRFLDLTQDFSLHTPAFAGYPGPAIRWIKRLAFEKAGGQEITMTLHVSTHLDAPAHFLTGGKFIGDLPLDFLIGPACVVDLQRFGIGDYDIYGPEHFERWEKDTGLRIERGDILVVHTGYHRYYPENWTDRSSLDETKYFIRHPGPARAFAEWVLDRGVRWIAIDAGSADHPMGDERDCLGEQRAHSRRKLRVLHLRLPRERLHGDPAVALVDPVQAGYAVDVDQVLRPGEPKVEERDQ